MLNHVLSPDAQVILLLCASFGQNRNIQPQPLTLSEYNRLAKVLIENKLRPGDLLSAKGLDILSKINDEKLNYERLVVLLERGGILAITLEKWVNQGLWIITRSDQNYPIKLKRNLQHLAPAIIYGVGNVELLGKGGLAIVGSRDINEEENEYTKRIGKVCASQGINVISGGAKGIDQEAMLGTLEAGGTVVGVLADSLNKASVSKKYRDSIRDGKLTLISTYDPNAGFNVGNAMGRNKYIYGLSDYALVVSSSFNKGGTWAGATEVLNKYQHIPVFVKMQGRVKEGNKALLDRGAKSFPEAPWNKDLKQFLSSHKTLETENYDYQLNLNFSLSKNSQASQTQLSTEITASKLENKSVIESGFKYQENSQKSQTFTEINQLKREDKPTQSKTVYETVLPIILENLRQPQNKEYLTEKFQLKTRQLEKWLKQAVAERKIIKTQNPVKYQIASPTQKNQNLKAEIKADLDIYVAVLPIILDNLKQPQQDKYLAKKLDVNINQIQEWLKIAETEGKIMTENHTKNIYVINKDNKQLYLFSQNQEKEENEAGLDW
ncbi:MAG: DNA-processing protein DprA [Microcoleaceae cyanobacterium MO_207.B10]|nr:DNA-processing protein DprA [Microcoleaceae cyanobacterium MO_207.B10]